MTRTPEKIADRFLSLSNRLMDKADHYRAGPGLVEIFSRSSPDLERVNEDRAAIIPVDDDSVVLVVADGLGGHPDGSTAAGITVNALHQAVKAGSRAGTELRLAILTGIENANHAIMEATSGAASTIAVVEINANTMRCYHVGDTEIMLTGQRGRIKYQTLAHSPVGYAVEAGLLDEGQAIMHEERHIVSNVLGYADMHVSIATPVRLAQYDTLLIASDGLFDNLQKSEITEIIRKGPLPRCSQALIAAATGRMESATAGQPSKYDDLSFILFRLYRGWAAG